MYMNRYYLNRLPMKNNDQNTNTRCDQRQLHNTDRFDDNVVRCYKCYESNHTSGQCRHDNALVCRVCGDKGHKAKHHQDAGQEECAGDNPGEVTNINVEYENPHGVTANNNEINQIHSVYVNVSMPNDEYNKYDNNTNINDEKCVNDKSLDETNDVKCVNIPIHNNADDMSLNIETAVTDMSQLNQFYTKN